MNRDRVSESRISRRTMLKGAGVAMALPWLESLPAFGQDLATGAAALPKRLAVLFMANGVNPNHWWAEKNGEQVQYGQSLEPLAPLAGKINYIKGLFNKNATGVGIHPGMTGNLLSGVSLQRGAELRGGVSMDQVLANAIGEKTVQPSMVLG